MGKGKIIWNIQKTMEKKRKNEIEKNCLQASDCQKLVLDFILGHGGVFIDPW